MSNIFNEVSIEDIAEIGQVLPVGRYTVRMLQCEGKLSQKGNPMLVVTYEVMDGDYSGLEATCWYTLMATVGKNGKTYASGLTEMKKIFASLGKPLPKDFKWQLGVAENPQSIEKSMALNRKLFMEKIGQTRLEMNAVLDRSNPQKEKGTDNVRTDGDGNTLFNMRYTIVGPANRTGGTSEYSSVAPAASPTAVTSSASTQTSDDELLAMLKNG